MGADPSGVVNCRKQRARRRITVTRADFRAQPIALANRSAKNRAVVASKAMALVLEPDSRTRKRHPSQPRSSITRRAVRLDFAALPNARKAQPMVAANTPREFGF